jgi:metallophosphoesterase superfamily enzyme
VGDLIHDKSGAHEFFSLITRLREQSDIILIGGNHDIAINRQRLNIDYSRFNLIDSFATDQFEFHHGDCDRKRNGRIQIIGHFHPAATLRDGAGLRLKFPALVQETNCWILPAFSPWAAGTEWKERERSRTWLCTPQRILLLSQEGQDLQDCAGLQKGDVSLESNLVSPV